MGKKIKAKIESRKGASILFALLVLLVCITVGSVVLTSGTAAAGRVGNLAEADQRYYAVSSAAELLKQSFDGQRVDIAKSRTTTTETVYSVAADGESFGEPEVATSSDISFGYTITQDGNNVTAETGLPIALAVRLIFGTDTPGTANAAIYETDFPAMSADLTQQYSLECSTSDAAHQDSVQALSCSVRCDLTPDGALQLRISSEDSAAAGGAYTMTLNFRANVQEDDSVQDSGDSVTTTDDSMTVTSTTVETKTYQLTWQYAGAEIAGK